MVNSKYIDILEKFYLCFSYIVYNGMVRLCKEIFFECIII